MVSTLLSLFAGFMIRPQDFPTFWIFVYWLDPLHYATEGIVVTQFYQDDTPITITATGQVVTAEVFVKQFYAEWSYKHRGYDVLALLLFIVGLR